MSAAPAPGSVMSLMAELTGPQGQTDLMINPPDHTRLRGLVAKVFTHRRIAELRPAVEAIAAALLDELEGAGDFVATVGRLAALILAAGFETTTGLLANGLIALLEHPAQADRWRHTLELSRTATEELLRYDSPVQVTYGRTAVDDIRVGDIELHAGQRLITMLGAANRDPAVFSAPRELRLDRDEGIPLSFGAGIHHCLGAALARLEGQVMFPKLLTRFPGLALAGEPTRRRSTTIRGFEALPVTTG